MDVHEHSSALALGWNLKSFQCDGMWSFSSSIGMDSFHAHIGMVLTILNIYGPYLNRVPFLILF